MAEKYSSDLGLVVIAQITQNIGYSCTLSAPLELLQDIMQKFMQEFARDLHGHTEHANRIEPSLRDVYLSIKSLNINVQELLDFIGNVEPVGFTRDVPQFPIKKTMNMNFLKPGSAETLTRPVYIFEYLPPMQRTESREIQLDTQNKFSQQREKSEFEATCSVEKLGKIHNRPISPNASIFPSNTFDSEIGRSVREMSSVVMTTGGFISPAIEGKLPEAFIPDIIEKYKGLDAPPSSSIVVHPLEYSPKVLPSEIESPTIPKKSISLQYSEINNINQNTAQLSNSQNAEGSLLSPSKNLKAAIAMNAGALKKTKKQKPDLATEQCQEDKYENSSTKTISAEEKSQRKALKIFQKLSKTHSISLNGHGKKSKKKVNRGSTSSDPNKISLEKIMKKQTKHRQKAIQLELDVKNYGFMQTSQTLSGFSAESNLNSENITSTDIPSGAPLIIKQTETSSQASSSFQVHEGDLQHSEILLPARKNACEPERSKLDVFKKISKPRAPRQEGGIASGSSGLGVRVFGSTISGPPIISLPSGTTITPTPLLGLNPAKINTSYMLDQIPPSPPKVADSEMPVLESVKSRKRGRKPGGKNFVKQTSFTSQSLVESAKREKTTHVIPLPLAPPTMIISENASMTLEPLNLCNVEQASSEPLQNLHTKDKKERKKSKTKPENILELCNKVYAPEKERNILTCQDQFMPVPSPISNPSLYPGNQAGIVPMLPLLHFPPRPGLIPSGPGLFPAVTGLVGFGNPVNTVSISPFIAFSGSEGSVANAVGCPPTIDSADIDSHQILKRSTSEKNVQMERNYCNVAPLVPDSMKLAECKKVTCEKTELDNTFANATPKSKTRPLVQASGNLGDPIEVSDDSDESLQNRQPPAQRKSPQCSPGHARSSLVQSQYLSLSSISEDVCHADFKRIVPALNSSESVAKVKKPVKLNLPDVKRIIHTPSPTTFPQFQNFSNFIGGDKYSLAGGADLIPLSRVDSGSAYSSQKVPSSSLTGGASLAINPILKNFNISEEQKCLPPTSSYEDITITPTGSSSLNLKVRKHHKKLKKLKEGKIKKKKDKKDKSKKKDRLTIPSYNSDRKIKGLDKKPKKEKKKDKQVLIHIPDKAHEIPQMTLNNNIENASTQSVLVSTPVLKSMKPTISSPNLGEPPIQIPKLTLKLSGKSTVAENENDTPNMEKLETLERQVIFPSEKKERERDNSPELARFSPLVTGPPKTKQSDTHFLGTLGCGPFLSNSSVNSTPVTPQPLPIYVRNTPINPPPINPHQTATNSAGWLLTPNNSNAASSTLAASSVLLPQQLMLPPTPIANNISPVTTVTKTETATKPGFYGSTTTSEEDTLQKIETSRPSSYVDAEGNRIWICPACGKVDDGSAMIGCDGCDAWYHWICVGITFAPKDNDDWFCRFCVAKRKEHGSEKKKKRNKKK